MKGLSSLFILKRLLHLIEEIELGLRPNFLVRLPMLFTTHTMFIVTISDKTVSNGNMRTGIQDSLRCP